MNQERSNIEVAPSGERSFNAFGEIEGRRTERYAICVAYWGQLDLEHNDCMDGLRDRFDRYRAIGCPYIDLARALLCRAAEDYAGVFFIDHDVLFDADDVERVIEAAEQQKTVVSGVYAERSSGRLRVVGAFREELSEVDCFKAGGLYPGYFAGLGFTAIPRRVLEAVGGPLPKVRIPATISAGVEWVKPMFALDTSEGWYSGEDISFYKRATRAGFPVVLDTRPRLYHAGRYRYGLEDAQIVVPRFDELKIVLRPEHPGHTTRPASDLAYNQGEQLAARLDAEDDARAAARAPLEDDREPTRVVMPDAQPAKRSGTELGAGLWHVHVPDDARGAWYDWLQSHPGRVEVYGSAPGDLVLINVLEAVAFPLALTVSWASELPADELAGEAPTPAPLEPLALDAGQYRLRVKDETGFAHWVSDQNPATLVRLDAIELPNDAGDGWLVELTGPVMLPAELADAEPVRELAETPTDAEAVTPEAAAVAEAMIAASETPVDAPALDEHAAELERVALDVAHADGERAERPIEAAEPPSLPGFKGVFDAEPPAPVESGFPQTPSPELAHAAGK